jgi:hypothetical protein
MIEIKELDLSNSRQKKQFVNFDREIYKNNPYWVAPLRMDINERLNPKKHPFYKQAVIKCFGAFSNGKMVGRIAAIDNFKYNEFHSSKTGFWGFFECIDDQNVANALFEKVEEWHRIIGNKTLQGPVNPSTNYESGLLLDAFDDKPKIMMSYNLPYYQKLIENKGNKLAMEMYAYKFNEADVMTNEKFLRVKDLVKDRFKVSIRNLDIKNIDKEIEIIKKIYNKAWENNWGFVPMSDEEFDLMAKEVKLIVDPGLAPIVENEKGEPIALALALRDINDITHSFNGNLFPFNFIKLLTNKKQIKWIRVLLLGILPEWRGKGIDALMYHHIIKNGLEMGIAHAEASWILATNEGMNKGVKVVNGEIYKRYGIFEKEI